MVAIMSLVPLLLIVGLFIAVVRVNKGLNRKPLTFQKNKWIIIGYMLVLVVATIFATLLPTSEAKIIKEDIDTITRNDDSYTKAYSGEFATIDQKDIAKDWNIPFSEASLNIQATNYEDSLLIERVEEPLDMIEVYYLEGYHMMELNSKTIDLGDYIPEVHVEMASNTLSINGPTQYPEIRLVYTEPEFPINQFLSDGSQEINGFSTMSGSRFVYIKIPKDIEVDINAKFVEYVQQ